MTEKIRQLISSSSIKKYLDYILIFWLAVVLAAYFYFHNYLSLYFIAIFLLFLFWLVWKLIRRFLKAVRIPSILNFFPWHIFLLVLSSAWLVVFIIYLVYILFPNINFLRAALAAVNIFGWLFLFLSFLLVFVIFFLSLGRKISSLLKIRIDLGLLSECFYLGIGLVLTIYFTYFLAWAGWLNQWFLGLALLIALIFFRQELRFYWRWFFLKKFSLKFKEVYVSEGVFSLVNFWIVFFIGFVLLFCSSLKLVAQTADDLAVYGNLPQLFSELGRMVPFYNSPTAAVAGISLPWEGGIFVLTGSLFVQLLPFFFIFAFLITLYLFLKRYFKEPIPEITVWLSLLAPWNVFFTASQKVDFIAVFFSLLAIIGLLIWYKNKKGKQYFYLAAVFLGAAVAVKFSVLLFALTLVFFFVYLLWRRQLKLKFFFAFGVVSFLFILPVLLFNYINYKNPLVHFLNFSKPIGVFFNSGSKVTMLDLFNHSSRLQTEKKFITNITRQNNLYSRKWKNWLWMIWNISVNQKGVKVVYVQPGPWFLIFFPFWLVYFWLGKLYKNKFLQVFYFMTMVGFVVWLLLGRQRPWYGLSMFYFNFILAAVYFKNLQNKLVKKITSFFIISFTAFFFLLSLPFINPNYIPVWAGEKSVASVRSENTWYSLAQLINKEAQKNPQMRVLVFPGQNAAYIKDNHIRVITSSYGYYWSQLVAEAGSLADIYDFLQAQGVTHILHLAGFEKWITSFATPAQNNSTLLTSFSIFPKFRQVYLEEVFCSGENCLYKLKENK